MDIHILSNRALRSARTLVVPNNSKDANRAVLVSMALLFLAMVLALIAFFSAANAAYAESPSIGKILYLPLVNATSNNELRSGEIGCSLDAEEEDFARIMINDPGQKRAELNCDPKLAAVAKLMATDMAKRGYFSAVNPEGMGPNQLVLAAEYDLPAFYGHSADANNVASIGAGYATAEAMWAGQAGNSQLLGTRDFYAAQTDYGIGHFYDPNSDFGHYWVVITARH